MMPTANATDFEFRCQNCSHEQFASIDDAGSSVTCTSCGRPCIVPEPNSDRRDDADDSEPNAENAFSYDAYKAALFQEEVLSSTCNMEQQLKEELSVPLSEMRDMSTIAASRMKRFLGSMLDGMLFVVAAAVGLVAFVALMGAGILKLDQNNPAAFDTINAICVIYFPVFALALFQWNMTATDGQTIAKKLLRMRIVTRNGQSPGFLQGVVLRWWGTALLGVIPFFGLLNILFIFGDSRRCIHDYLAGTYVVDV